MQLLIYSTLHLLFSDGSKPLLFGNIFYPAMRHLINHITELSRLDKLQNTRIIILLDFIALFTSCVYRRRRRRRFASLPRTLRLYNSNEETLP